MNKTEIINEITQGVTSRINSKKVAYQFVLEELDAARQGNDVAMLFVQDSGFFESEYVDAMQNSFEEVDGANGPQQFLLNSVMPYASNMDIMVNVRLSVVENIIKKWQLKADTGYRIKHLMNSLKKILENDEDVMPAITLNIPVPENAKARHIHFREKNISSAKNIIILVSKLTGDDDEAIIRKSLLGSQINPTDHKIHEHEYEPELKKEDTEDINIFIKFGYGVVSFFVGLSAFFVFKLLFMIPLNLMATPENLDSIKGIGALLIFLAIYLAVKYTKKLNKSGTRKSRIKKRVATIIAGFISMIITTIVVNLPII